MYMTEETWKVESMIDRLKLMRLDLAKPDFNLYDMNLQIVKLMIAANELNKCIVEKLKENEKHV